MEHVNRKGQTYFILQGATKTGKPKYYASRKSTGSSVESLPPDMEIYELPTNATVTVRKKVTTRLREEERAILERAVRTEGHRHFQVAIEGDAFVVYLPSQSEEETTKTITMLMGIRISGTRHNMSPGLQSKLDWMMLTDNWLPLMRFTLTDDALRLFEAERWCFRGSIDDWFPLFGRNQTLEKLAKALVPHLGRESFFELM